MRKAIIMFFCLMLFLGIAANAQLNASISSISLVTTGSWRGGTSMDMMNVAVRISSSGPYIFWLYSDPRPHGNLIAVGHGSGGGVRVNNFDIEVRHDPSATYTIYGEVSDMRGTLLPFQKSITDTALHSRVATFRPVWRVLEPIGR